jgi:hypothetical protein
MMSLIASGHRPGLLWFTAALPLLVLHDMMALLRQVEGEAIFPGSCGATSCGATRHC